MAKNNHVVRDVEEINEAAPERHVLHLPGMYLGSIEKEEAKHTVCRVDEEGKLFFEKGVKMNISEGLENLFREIIINARDAISEGRDLGSLDNDIYIKVTNKKIVVTNGGNTLPVKKKTVVRDGKEYKVWAPTSTFFRMFAGSNFNKDIGTTKILNNTNTNKNNTGRNGVGSKLANIFSKWFQVECFDGENFFLQVARENMSIIEEPIIREATEEEKESTSPFVRISFILDFERFGFEEYDDDMLALIRYHCAFIAYNSQIRITLNKDVIEPMNVYQFAALEIGDDTLISSAIVGYDWPDNVKYRRIKSEEGPLEVTDTLGKGYNLEYLFVVVRSGGRQISSVNGNVTKEGGKHVDAVHKACKFILDEVNSKVKDKKNRISLKYLKDHMIVFVNARVNGLPDFNNNTKTLLRGGKFNCVLSEKNCKKLRSSELKNLLEYELEQHTVKISGGTGPSRGRYPLKLDDAFQARKPRSKRDGNPCYLVLTEGDSAAKLVKIYFEDDREHYGCLPMRGKVINAKKVKTMEKLLGNIEFVGMMTSVGLVPGMDYSDDANRQTLRYDGILIACDQDVDGSHLKLLNYSNIRHMWPELTERKDFFIGTFETALLSATKGKERIPFYNAPEFAAWYAEDSSHASWTLKYYKGLAAFSKAEIRKDRKAKTNKLIRMVAGEGADDSLNMAFKGGKNNVIKRQEHILSYDPNFIAVLKKKVDVSFMVDRILVEHSIASIWRTLVAWDGFKEAGRKLATTVLLLNKKGKFTDLIRTDALCGKVTEEMEYHHGGASLSKTIERLTQSYPGTSNLPFLQAEALFSDRDGEKGGQERYTSTLPPKWWSYVFKNVDLSIVPRKLGERKKNGKPVPIEFEYIPQVIPYLLCSYNRSIGVGWGSFIPGCKPKDLIKFCRAKLNNESIKELKPWARGFKGSLRIVETAKLKKVDQEVDQDDIEKSLKDDDIEKSVDDTPKNPIDEVDEDNIAAGDNTAMYSLVITGKWKTTPDGLVDVTEIPLGYNYKTYKKILNKMKDESIIKDFYNAGTDEDPSFIIEGMVDPSEEKLHLRRVIKLSNMNMLGSDQKPLHFATLTDLANMWYDQNLPHYAHRRKCLLKEFKDNVVELRNKHLFVKLIADKEIDIFYRKKADVLADAQSRGVDIEYVKTGMDIFSVTEEYADKLHNNLIKKEAELALLKSKKPEDLWLEDLDELEAAKVL